MSNQRLALYHYLKELRQQQGTLLTSPVVATSELLNWVHLNGNGRIRFGWPPKSKKVKFHEINILESGKSPLPAEVWMDQYLNDCRNELDKCARHLAKVLPSQEELRDAYQGSPLLKKDEEWINKFKIHYVGEYLMQVRPIMEGYFIISESELHHFLTFSRFR